IELSGKEKAEQEKDRKKLEAQINKLSTEITEIKESAVYRNAFEWRFEFPEVLDEKGNYIGFDVVIGNPPYIEHKKLSKISSYLKDKYSVYYSSADISSYFFELGANILKRSGILTFISTNKFFRTEYGKPLRSFISNMNVFKIVNFEQVPVFDEALVSSLILSLSKDSQKHEISYSEFFKEAAPDHEFISEIDKREVKVPKGNLKDTPWSFSGSEISKLFDKIMGMSVKIKNVGSIDIRRGITTGYDPAFIISNDTASNLLLCEKNLSDVIKPLLKGKEIKRYAILQSEQKLIYMYWHFPLKNNDNVTLSEAEEAFIMKYPNLYEYFLGFKNDLMARNKEETGIRYEWYALQRCAASYYDNFEEEKIIWPLTADKWGFALDKNKFFLSSGGFMLISKEINLKYILAILNSKLMEFIFSQIGVKTAGGAYTLKKATIDELPLLVVPDSEQRPFIDLVDKILGVKKKELNANLDYLEYEMDHLVYQLYGLTEDEIEIVERG
ncbi:MAG: Eco57I restriction-modification methylase domain-containing protein, partial [Spirochaetes bacterium]|nr:Eco57I restriction-modification methylase domain-containing protein [Spirochaetota bacterium]